MTAAELDVFIIPPYQKDSTCGRRTAGAEDGRTLPRRAEPAMMARCTQVWARVMAGGNTRRAET